MDKTGLLDQRPSVYNPSIQNRSICNDGDHEYLNLANYPNGTLLLFKYYAFYAKVTERS